MARIGHRRSFQAGPPGEWFFAWTARTEEEARAALRDALEAVVSSLPAICRLPAVWRLEILNPSTGFAISEDRPLVVTGDFAQRIEELFSGEHAELATLMVNGRHRASLSFDARSFVSGHLAVTIEEEVPPEVVARLEREYPTGHAGQAS